MAFKLKSQGAAFKMMGSSPARKVGGNNEKKSIGPKGKPMIDKDGDGIPVGVDRNDTPGGRQSTTKNTKRDKPTIKKLKPTTKKAPPTSQGENQTFKDLPTNPTGNVKPRKDNLKGLTNFQYDMIPVTNTVNKIGKGIGDGTKLLNKTYKTMLTDGPTKVVKRVVKEAKKYFTKK